MKVLWIGALMTGIVTVGLGTGCGGDSSGQSGDGGGNDGSGESSGAYSSSGSGGSSGGVGGSGTGGGSGGSSSGSSGSGSSGGVSSGGSGGSSGSSGGTVIGDAGAPLSCGGDGSACLTGQVCCIGARRTGNTCQATCSVGTQVCATNADCPAGEVCMGIRGVMTCRAGRGLDGGQPMRDAATNG